jgi:hypothetical protein
MSIRGLVSLINCEITYKKNQELIENLKTIEVNACGIPQNNKKLSVVEPRRI